MFNFLSNIEPANMTVFGGSPTLSAMAGLIINLLIGVGFSICLVTLSYSAIQYALSKGDPKLTQKAWHGFLWSVIAAAFSLGALSIKQAILINLTGTTTPEIVNNVPGF